MQIYITKQNTRATLVFWLNSLCAIHNTKQNLNLKEMDATKDAARCPWTTSSVIYLMCTTFSNGCHGSHNDEERSEMRYVMRIAGPRESSKFWTHIVLPGYAWLHARLSVLVPHLAVTFVCIHARIWYCHGKPKAVLKSSDLNGKETNTHLFWCCLFLCSCKRAETW